MTFPLKLHQILGEPALHGIISWNEDGDAFSVLDASRLGPVLRQYGMTSVYRSFQRQLNLYGFKNTGRGLVHPMFCRDRPDILNSITRSLAKSHLQKLGADSLLYQPGALDLIQRTVSAMIQGDQVPRLGNAPSMSLENNLPLQQGSVTNKQPVQQVSVTNKQPESGLELDEEIKALEDYYLNDFDFMNIPCSGKPLSRAEIALFNRYR